MHRLVVIRHGESVWNQENRFTGWTDVELSEKGRAEARKAAALLKSNGYSFDYCYTSLLKRAIHTLWIILDELDLAWLPTEKSWRLNERHYGALQGLNKTETAAKYGDAQIHIWRRSFDTPPPALDPSDPRYPIHDPRYQGLKKSEVPYTESLKDTIGRALPYWHTAIAPTIKESKRVLIAAHGNSLRALVKYLDGISDQEIPSLEIPTGVPLVYELDAKLMANDRYYLTENGRQALR